MKLVIDHIGKIGHAELDFRGITVIAGNNNTGKSTIGKTLFATFCSLRNLDKKVASQRNAEKCDALEETLNTQAFGELEVRERRPRRLFGFLPLSVLRSLDFSNKQDVETKVKKSLERVHVIAPDEKKLFSEIWKRIDAVDETADGDIIAVLVDRVFGAVFNGQISSLSIQVPSEIELVIQKRKIKLAFEKNKNTDQEIPFPLTNKALFIQSPDIIDSLDNGRAFPYRRSYLYEEDASSQLLHYLSGGVERTAVAEAQARKKLERVYALLDEVIPGGLTKDSDGDVFYDEKGFSEPLSISNLSTGLKSFALLYLLLENGGLEDKDVLILDEPEVNLHPEWQLKYAELIVLLEKVFHLTILLTTHSPYFLRAIEMYSRKHGVGGDCDYYLAGLDENQEAIFQNVNGHLESIYREMAKPFDVLNDIDDNLGGE